MNKKSNQNFKNTLKDYLVFLKTKKRYESKDRFRHENNIEKLNNWSGSNFKKTLKWYFDVKKITNLKLNQFIWSKWKSGSMIKKKA